MSNTIIIYFQSDNDKYNIKVFDESMLSIKSCHYWTSLILKLKNGWELDEGV